MPDKRSNDNVYMQCGEHLLHFERTTLAPEFVDVARRQLRETSEIKRDALATLRKLVEADPDLYFPLDKDENLIQFLRPCKFYPHSAYEKMKLFFAFKMKYPAVYRELLPSRETNVFHQSLVSVLPNRDQHGRRIMLIQGGRRWKPRECSLNEVMRGVFLLVEAAIFEAKSQIAGGVLVMDLEDIPFNHVFQFTPSFAKMVSHYVQDCIPIRLKAIHIINQNYFFNLIFSVFKPLLREKMRSRIHLHGFDRESLLKHMDPKCVPTRYGGDMDIPDDFPGKNLHEMVLQYEEEFRNVMTYGYASDDRS